MILSPGSVLDIFAGKIATSQAHGCRSESTRSRFSCGDHRINAFLAVFSRSLSAADFDPRSCFPVNTSRSGRDLNCFQTRLVKAVEFKAVGM